MQIFEYKLSNGIRVIHHPIVSPVAHCGLIVNTGSRDEKNEEHGLAHFIEHVIFKGTRKRKTYHILSRIDDVGGELNAYTTKEETYIYATFLKNDLERAIELLSDIAFNSTFPSKELTKEKEVIIDEINSYKDNPSELIIDDFEELIFDNDPMGRNILGTSDSISSFNKSHIQKFMKNNYHTDEMVFCVVGEFKPEKILKYSTKYFGHITENYRQFKRPTSIPYIPKAIDKTMDTFQTHTVIGNVAYDVNHPDRLGLLLLNNILGGPGMNSRLNLALREKNGIAYNIESIYSPYSGTGLFCIYFGTDDNNINKSLKIVEREMRKMRDFKLGKLQLHNAQRQLKGQITIANQNMENLMLGIGKSYLLHNKVDSLETIYDKIDEISSVKLMEIANEILNPNQLSYLLYRQSDY